MHEHKEEEWGKVTTSLTDQSNNSFPPFFHLPSLFVAMDDADCDRSVRHFF